MLALVKATILSLTMLGNGQQIAHMRNAPEGADARAERFARYIVDASEQEGIDPLFVVAVIFSESGFNPDRRGKLGERGLMQLHPRSPWYREARRTCRNKPGTCQRAMVFEGVKLLRWALDKCYTVELAIGAYRTKGGRCIRIRGARRVLRTYVQIGAYVP